MNTETPQLVISRVFDAPRQLVYRAFTDLQQGIEPFETRLRVEFHDEADGRTRLEIRQWLPEHLAHPSGEGWFEAFTKLDAMLMNVQAVAADQRKVAAWQS